MLAIFAAETAFVLIFAPWTALDAIFAAVTAFALIFAGVTAFDLSWSAPTLLAGSLDRGVRDPAERDEERDQRDDHGRAQMLQEDGAWTTTFFSEARLPGGLTGGFDSTSTPGRSRRCLTRL